MRMHQDAVTALAIILSIAGASSAQNPTSLTLKAKVRDFREINNTGATPTHPHFYGMSGHGAGCSSQESGDFAVLMDIDTSFQENSAVFRGDKRGPRINPAMPARMAACFTPQDRFTDWFDDKSTEINRPFLIDLVFTYNAATGTYSYNNGAFFPIDNGKVYTPIGGVPTFGHLLTGPSYGVESSLHNYGFTMEFHTEFTYVAGSNQTFNFQGDDDVWVFINGKRVIDLGGPHPAQNAAVNLDQMATTLGLVDQRSYPLDFFFAERHTSTSSLIITTSLVLAPLPPLAPPVLEPSRTFLDRTQVTITHPDPAAVIHYTTNGSNPTTASPVYTGPIPLSATTTLRALAVKPGHLNSPVVQAVYTREAPALATPVATPPGQDFVGALPVTLSVPGQPTAQIRYTLDGTEPTSASPLYGAPLNLVASTVVKAKAFLATFAESGVMTETYRRLVAAQRGVYLDENGDGRIDMALIRLDQASATLPAAVVLKDPFLNADATFSGATITLGSDPMTLVVRFEKPFAPGTAFLPGNYGSIPSSPGWSPAPFPMADSAGPVLIKAVTVAGKPGQPPYLDVTFSEPLNETRLGVAWPFDLIRNGTEVPAEVRVTGVGPVAGQPNTYRWTLDPESPALPVYIDSLQLADLPKVFDIGGVAGQAGKKRVPVEGEKAVFVDSIHVKMSKPVSDAPLQGGTLITQVGKDNLISALAGPDGALTCLTCQPGTEGRFTNTPEWTVRARHPLQYTFRIFDNLGQHVATAKGNLTAEMLDKAVKDAEGYRLVRFRWLPAGVGNRAAGTGAYVLKGSLFTDRTLAPRGSQGEPIDLAPGDSQVLLTFGYLRK